jgi:hypothetical protein
MFSRQSGFLFMVFRVLGIGGRESGWDYDYTVSLPLCVP